MKRILYFFIPFLLVGCISVKYINTGGEYKALPATTEVKVFLSKLPDTGYDEIGILVIGALKDENLMEQSLNEAKQKARAVGGNALIKLPGVEWKFAIVKIKTD
ncbi:MAG: hypothetical protein JW969_07685 [Spirochaetales bacterium]|nr:hypothetical protein [Spirochaetales bacterium]